MRLRRRAYILKNRKSTSNLMINIYIPIRFRMGIFLQPRLPQTSSLVAGTFSVMKMYHKLYQYEIQLCTLKWYIFCTEQNQVQIKVNFWYNNIPKFGTFLASGKNWYTTRYKICTHYVP